MADAGTNFRIELAEPDRLRELEENASPELKDHFERIKDGLEAIPGVPRGAFYNAVTLRALALKPDIFYSVFLTEHHAMKHGEIPTKVKELVAIAVAKENELERNAVCAPYHAGAARLEGANEDSILAIASDESAQTDLDGATRTVVDFGVKAALRPNQVNDSDVQAVRDLGYGDAAIVELITTALVTYLLSALNPILNLKEGV
jgi:AhpD family alkylhydroperoxidase